MPPASLRRLRSSVRRWVRGPVPVAWHPSFRVPLAGLEAITGMDPKRAESVLTWLLDVGIVAQEDLLDAPEAPWSWAREVHDAEYLATLDQAEVIAQITSIDAARLSVASVVETWRRAVGGAVAAAISAADGRSAASLAGGFHHAAPDRGAGFCGLSDVGIAIARLRDRGFADDIVVYDLDAHPPDGLAACVQHDRRVSIASLGVASEWTVKSPILDVRVPPKSQDAAWLAGLEQVLRDAPSADLAFVLAGADPLVGDRFGNLACTESGLAEGHRRVLGHLRGVPVVLLPAGGYTPGAWRVFANAVAMLASSRQRVVRGYDPVLRRTRDVAKALDPQTLGSADDWSDIAFDLHLPNAEPRLLGFYTRAGIEYALSRFGILSALARMGFRGIAVELFADQLPHRARITAEVDGRREVLAELSLSKRAVEGWPTLFVEWLSLRDPRGDFNPARPQLPGQERPGLGMAEEFGHLLVRIADRLGLAGVSFVPAHYHVAWMVRDRFRFVDPVGRGRFEAIRDAVRGLPLPEASRKLDEEGLAVEYGEPVRWEPALMVAPGDPELTALLASSDAVAAAAREGVTARLLSGVG